MCVMEAQIRLAWMMHVAVDRHAARVAASTAGAAGTAAAWAAYAAVDYSAAGKRLQTTVSRGRRWSCSSSNACEVAAAATSVAAAVAPAAAAAC